MAAGGSTGPSGGAGPNSGCGPDGALCASGGGLKVLDCGLSASRGGAKAPDCGLSASGEGLKALDWLCKPGGGLGTVGGGLLVDDEFTISCHLGSPKGVVTAGWPDTMPTVASPTLQAAKQQQCDTSAKEDRRTAGEVGSTMVGTTRQVSPDQPVQLVLPLANSG